MNAGIRYMLLATFFFALMNVLIKWVNHLPTYEIIFFRSLISVAISMAVIRKAKLPMWGNNIPVLLLRGVFGFISLSLYFFTLKEIPLASAVTIQYLSPIFSTLLAIYLLKQPMQNYKWLFYALSFTGVLVVKGFDDRVSNMMLAFGVGSALFSGFAYNMIGKLKDQDDPRVVVLYFPLVTVPLALVPTIINWITPNWLDALILVGIGITTQLGQQYMTQSFQAENVGKVSIFQYIGIIYALFFGYVFFDEGFSPQAIMGMLLVVGGVSLSVLFSRREKNTALPSGK